MDFKNTETFNFKGANMPEHPKQISRVQSRPLAFARMCLKAALTAIRLICTKTMAGCDMLIPQN